jgi:hypothetical protein
VRTIEVRAPSSKCKFLAAGQWAYPRSVARSFRILTSDGVAAGGTTTYVFNEIAAWSLMQVRRRPGRTQRLIDPTGRELASVTDPDPYTAAQPALDLQWPVSDALVIREFVPANNKLEAVTRLARLADRGPESLGPGSKERKSVLIKLAGALELEVDTSLPKPQLGEQIASRIGAPWGADCWSTGSTLTLQGLNALLQPAERHLANRGRGIAEFSSVEAEAAALLGVLAKELPMRLDGRSCVSEMRHDGYSQWAQDEWAGFFLEYRGLPALVRELGGGPVKYANTRFDYALNGVWDLKCHSVEGRDAPLNDVSATRACLSERTLGFLVLSGRFEYDDGSFRAWFREERTRQGKTAVVRQSPATYVRRSKAAFEPMLLEAFVLRDLEQLEQAQATGALDVLQQGRQTSGASRPPKYRLRLPRARQDLRVAQRSLGRSASEVVGVEARTPSAWRRSQGTGAD